MTFVIIFVGIYSLLNFYVLRRLAHLFKIRPGIGFYTLLVVCTLSYIAAAVLDRVYANGFSRMIYLLASTWMGTGFLLFSCLLVYEVATVLFKPPPVASGIVICSVVAVLSLYATINAHRITVTNVDIEADIDMNIVQLSDIHLGSTRAGFLEQVVEKTNSLAPDLVLITGDLLESHRSITPATLEPLNDLLAPAFFVTGNHDGYAGIDRTM
ncbi:MAG: metallophosphoesterase, partial [Planctomycetes bacterium]|nr:metallophosphoesterase [Planctomycetota bacterium]